MISQTTNHKNMVLLLIIVGIGLTIRIPLFALYPLTSDQGLYASLAVSIFNGDWFLEIDHPSDKFPLFYYIQALFLSLLGHSERTLILPNLITGLLNIILVYRIGARLFTSYAGLIASFLMAVSPLMALYSGNSFVESTFLFFYLLAFIMLLSQKWKYLGVFIALAFATKQSIIIFSPLILAGIWILQQTVTPKLEIRSLLRISRVVFKWFVISFSPFFVWSLYFSFYPLRALEYLLDMAGFNDQAFLGTYLDRWNQLKYVLTDLSFGNYVGVVFFIIISIHVIWTTSISLYQLIKTHEIPSLQKRLWEIALYGYFCAYIILNIFFVARFFAGRFFYPVMFLVFILVGHSIVDFASRFPAWFHSEKILGKMQYVLLVLITFYCIFIPVPQIASMSIFEKNMFRSHQEIRTIPQVLKEQGSPRDMLFYKNSGRAFRYYIPHRMKKFYDTFEDLPPLIEFAKQHPYRDAFILIYEDDFDKLDLLDEITSPLYDNRLVHSSALRTYKMFKLIPKDSEHANQPVIDDKQQFIQELLANHWSAHSIQVDSIDNKLKILASPVNFFEVKGAEFYLEVLHPSIDFKASTQRQWPIFDQNQKLEFQYKFTDRSIEKIALRGEDRPNTIKVHTKDGQTRLHLEKKVEGINLVVDSTFKIILKNSTIFIDVLQLEVNGWNITWLANILENRFLKKEAPRSELFDGTLYAIQQNNGQIVMKFHR